METSPVNPRPERTWLQRNTRWIVLSMILATLLLLASFIVGILYVVNVSMRSSEMYQTALTRAQMHPAVIEALGKPIETGILVSGSIQLENDQGTAALQIPIYGPRGEATISVAAVKHHGTWSYQHMEISGESLDAVNLLHANDPPVDRR